MIICNMIGKTKLNKQKAEILEIRNSDNTKDFE